MKGDIVMSKEKLDELIAATKLGEEFIRQNMLFKEERGRGEV